MITITLVRTLYQWALMKIWSLWFHKCASCQAVVQHGRMLFHTLKHSFILFVCTKWQCTCVVKVALHIPSTELTSFLDIYIDCGVNCFLLLTMLSNEDGLLLLALLIVLALSCSCLLDQYRQYNCCECGSHGIITFMGSSSISTWSHIHLLIQLIVCNTK